MKIRIQRNNKAVLVFFPQKNKKICCMIIWQVRVLVVKIDKKDEKKHLINFFVRKLQHFLKQFKKWIFAIKNLKKSHPQKLLRNTIFFSSFLPLTGQMAQTEEFMSQNLAYRHTVYRIGRAIKKTKNSNRLFHWYCCAQTRHKTSYEQKWPHFSNVLLHD